MQRLANYINGQFVPPGNGQYLDVVEPATGEPLAEAPDSWAPDVDRAVGAAAAAFPGWSATPAGERSRILFKLADLINANLDRLARAESADSGKPLALARTIDIPRSAANFRYFAGAVLHTSSEMHETDNPAIGQGEHAINYTLRRPRGVAGLISPWNLPLYLLSWKLAPALATGNTCIAKPSEVTPLSASILCELASEAGLPPGVLNVVHGTGQNCGAEIVRHPDVPTISFTGSTPVGKWIAQTAGSMLKRVSLELGGKNAFIVFDDADLSRAVTDAVRAGFTNQGQICLCGSRLLIHKRIYDAFLTDFVERVAALRVGDPLDEDTRQGALVTRHHLRKVDALVREAKELGGIVHCGGHEAPEASLPERCRAGFFYLPTVISGLDPTCRPEQEEIFGPVVTVQKFDDEEHAVRLANSTRYGLSATLFTGDVSRAHRVAARLDAGVIWVNTWMLRDLRTPFGGVKQSGVGREGGLDAIRFFTEPRNVCIRI